MSGINNQSQYSIHAEGAQQHYRVEYDDKAGQHKLYIGNKACVVKQSGNIVTDAQELQKIADLFTKTLKEEKIGRGEKWQLDSEGVTKMKGGTKTGTVKVVNKELYQAGIQPFLKTAASTNEAAKSVLGDENKDKSGAPLETSQQLQKKEKLDLSEPREDVQEARAQEPMPDPLHSDQAHKSAPPMGSGETKDAEEKSEAGEIAPAGISQESSKKTPLERKCQEFVSISKSLQDITAKVLIALNNDTEAFSKEIELLNRLDASAKGFVSLVERCLDPVDTNALVQFVTSSSFKELSSNIEEYVLVQGDLEKKLASRDTTGDETVGSKLKRLSKTDVGVLSIKPVQILPQLQLHMIEIVKEFEQGSQDHTNMQIVQEAVKHAAGEVDNAKRLLDTQKAAVDCVLLNNLLLKCNQDPTKRITLNDAGELVIKEKKQIPGQNRVIKSGSASVVIQMAQNAKNLGIDVTRLVDTLNAMKDFKAILKKYPQIGVRFNDLASKSVETKAETLSKAVEESEGFNLDSSNTQSSEEVDELSDVDELPR